MLKFTESFLGWVPRLIWRQILTFWILYIQNFSLCLESKLENNPVGNASTVSTLLSQAKIDTGESKFPGKTLKILFGFLSVQRYFCQYDRKQYWLPSRPVKSFWTIGVCFSNVWLSPFFLVFCFIFTAILRGRIAFLSYLV